MTLSRIAYPHALLALAGVSFVGGFADLAAQSDVPPTPSSPDATAETPEPPPAVSIEADEPWRLDDALGTPDWLKISGHARVRWEGIEGQFRSAARLNKHDHFAVSRSALRADIDLESLDLPAGVTVEVLDARHYGAGVGSFMNTTIVNPLDVLQAYAELRFGDLAGGDHALKVGRYTMDVGSRRLVARNRYRNTINAFDGVHWEWKDRDSERNAEFQAFLNTPVQREPRNFEQPALFDNEMQWDKQDTENLFWGLFGAADTGVADTRIEGYVFGIDEDGRGTLRRNLTTPGFRLQRGRKTDEIDFQVESAIQFGESRLASSGTQDLDHLAWFTHASVGYTFDAAWSPNVRLAWDYASGDDDPTDGDNGRFNTLFGARRFEYGPTGIYGAVARANLNSPEVRLSLKPAKHTDAFIAWRGVFLAEDRDAWTTARVQDPTGAAGNAVGNQFEARVRWNILPKSLRFEVGGAMLLAGSFQKDAPGGQGRDTYYGYSQLIWTF